MKKTLIAGLLSVFCLCGAILPALASDTPQVTDANKVVPYSEAEDPLANRSQRNADASASDAPMLHANNDSGKSSHYSPFTDNTYSVPSGYHVFDGIDVSKWNEDIDWDAVKDDGITFALIRVGYRGTGNGSLAEDPYFESNIRDALRAGIAVGVYIYSQALTTEEARAEAQFVLDRIADYNITLPVVMDYEFYGTEGRLYNANLSKSQATNNCLAFCDTVTNAGYTPMVYANKSYLENNLDDDKVSAVAPIWLAHYTTNTGYSGEYDYWQYSADGHVNGVDGVVDCNFFFSKEGLPPDRNDSYDPDIVRGFSDVHTSAWYADAVAFAVDNELMFGTSDTTFEPNTTLDRAMIAQILYNMTGKPAVEYGAIFSDVGPNQWYTDAIEWAYQNNVMSGYTDGTFGINDPVTREQTATAFYNYSRRYGISVDKTQSLDTFTDASSVSDFAVTAMQWAVANGVMNGTTSTTLEPQNSTNRAQCAAILKNYLSGVGASLLS